MYKRILVPLDGSTRAEQAIPIAARIAHASSGSVMLLHVVSIPIELGPNLRQSVSLHEAINADILRATAYLANTVKSYELAGAETKVAVSSGSEALTITDIAKEQHADLIVMASHGYTGFKRWMLGSVAQRVVRSSPAPVLVLRDGGTLPSSPYPDKTRPLHTITAVVALDGSKLAESALLPAANLVAALVAPAQGSLLLTQVVPPPKADERWHGLASVRREQTIDEAASYLSKIASELREALEENFNLAISWSVAVDSDVPGALTRVAEHGKVDKGAHIFNGCDILALATHGRTGLQRLALGSVTERILGSTKLPLLIVRPQQAQLASVTSKLARHPQIRTGYSLPLTVPAGEQDE